MPWAISKIFRTWTSLKKTLFQMIFLCESDFSNFQQVLDISLKIDVKLSQTFEDR